MGKMVFTLIAIAVLVGVLVDTSMDDGSTVGKSDSAVPAARLLYEGQSIAGAVKVLRADLNAGKQVEVKEGGKLSDLTGGRNPYLNMALPAWDMGTLISTGMVMTREAQSRAVCKEVNDRAGLKGRVSAESVKASFGCERTGRGEPGRVFYKF